MQFRVIPELDMEGSLSNVITSVESANALMKSHVEVQRVQSVKNSKTVWNCVSGDSLKE